MRVKLARILLAPSILLVGLHCGDPSSSAIHDASPQGDAAKVAADADLRAGWQSMADVGGGPIQETGVAALGGKVYVVGGFDETLQIGSRVQVYDPAEDSWAQVAPLPIAVHHANVVAANGSLYVLGAMQLSGFSFVAISDSYVYAPDTDTWTPLAPIPKGSERGSAAIGVLENRIVLAGGLRGDAIADVIAYDIESNAWETGWPPLPSPTDHLVGAAIDNVLYAIGGRDGGIDSVKDSVLSFALGDAAWTERASMPTARGGAAAAVVEGRIVVVGGEGNPNAGNGVFPQVEFYDPAENIWSTLPDMPSPRHGMGAAGIGDTLYVPGGASKQGFGATATSERYRFD